MVAFAEAADLAKLLNRVFTADEIIWVDDLLDAASTYLRSAIGQDVYPQTQSTFVAYPDSGRVDLPQWPVVSVDTVERDAVAVDFTYRPGFLMVSCDDPVDVTFTWGYATAPPELVRLACVLVSQALLTLENDIGLTAGGLSSVAIDDFKLAWADAGEQSGMTLTRHAEAAVKRQFGRGGSWVVDTV